MRIDTLKSVSRSARPASRFQLDTATVEEVIGIPAAVFGASSLVGSVVASAYSRVPHRAVSERIHVERGRTLSQSTLRIVRRFRKMR